MIDQVAQLFARHIGFDPHLSDYGFPHCPHVSLVLFAVELHEVEVNLSSGCINPPRVLVSEKSDDLRSLLTEAFDAVIPGSDSEISNYLLGVERRELPADALNKYDSEIIGSGVCGYERGIAVAQAADFDFGVGRSYGDGCHLGN